MRLDGREVDALRPVKFTSNFIEPAEGWLACRTVGKGRMAEADTIIEAVVQQLKKQSTKAPKS